MSDFHVKRFPGVYLGVVWDTSDPENRGRLRLRIPMVLGGDTTSEWAEPCFSPGAARTLPAIGKPVWVSFQAGDPDHPVWMGSVNTTGSGGSLVGVHPAPQVAQMGDGLLKIAAPSYFYPTYYQAANGSHDWERLQASAPVADLAVINPNNGPPTAGSGAYTDFSIQFQRAQASGLRVLGYIHTTYGTRAPSAVMADMDSYLALFPSIDGFFFDECDTAVANQPKYLSYYNYLKGKNPNLISVVNPGTPSMDESYMQACDIVMISETVPSTWLTPPGGYWASWMIKYPASRFWGVVHDVVDIAQRDQLVAVARQQRLGYVYLTPGLGSGNPYGNLPSDTFWNGLVSQISAPARGLVGTTRAATTSAATPSATAATYGAAQIVYPTTAGLLPVSVSLMSGGTFAAGETLTARVTAKFSDGASVAVTKAFTATGASVTLSPADLSSLVRDGTRVSWVALDAQSSAASSAASATASVVALNV